MRPALSFDKKVEEMRPSKRYEDVPHTLCEACETCRGVNDDQNNKLGISLNNNEESTINLNTERRRLQSARKPSRTVRESRLIRLCTVISTP